MSEKLLSIPMTLSDYGAPVLSMVAGEMVKLMQWHDAPNFMGFHIPRPDGDLMLTIQRVSGETPEAQCTRLKGRVKVLKDALKDIADARRYGDCARLLREIRDRAKKAMEATCQK